MTAINRVTQRTVAQRSLAGLQGNLTRVSGWQEKLSSGKLINRPSDSPSGTGSALQMRGDIRRNAQWARNADDGMGWLGQLNDSLMGMNASVGRVRELTLQGMNTGSLSAEGREALAAEVDQLRASLLSEANTTYLGRPVFGGTTGGQKAYTDTQVANPDGTFTSVAVYTGTQQQVSRTVGANASVRVDLSGPEAFGPLPAALDPSGNDLFATLTKIAKDLRTDPSQLGGDLDTLNLLAKNMQNKLSDVGARYNRVEQSKQAAEDRGLTLTDSLSEIESIDLPETIMQLELANVGYQAALGATAKVIQPSLMDFLR
jgi:flagellar hook-associated protein 3 FlgL